MAPRHSSELFEGVCVAGIFMNFNFIYDSTMASAPSGYTTALDAAANILSHLFTNNITLNIQVGYGEVDGSSITGNAAAEASPAYSSQDLSYTQWRTALAATASSPADTAALAGLSTTTDPTTNIAGPGYVQVSTAEEKALGLLAGNAPGLDGYIGINASTAFTHDSNLRSAGPTIDAIGAIIHEITHVMGRVSVLGLDTFAPLDLFRYASAGVRDLTAGNGGYFSVDGTTMLDAYNSSSDLADWASGVIGDSFGSASYGVEGALSSADLQTMDVLGYTRAAAVYHDFMGGGVSDLLWYNAAANAVGEFDMTHMNYPAWTGIGAAGAGWTVAGSGDFNGDRTSDILWYNAALNGVGEFQMNNGSATWVGIGTAGSGWSFAGVGDFNGDKTSDILWYNASTNALGEFQMNNNVPAWRGIGSVGAGWKVAGIGDLNGDGTSDILFFNSSTNALGEFQMQNNTPSWVGLGNIGAGWSVAGVGDFNGDGTSDILLYNASTNSVGEFQMNGGKASWVGIGSAGAGWTVAGIGDINGDGASDIIWTNATTHAVGAFLMGANNTPTWFSVGASSAGWTMVA